MGLTLHLLRHAKSSWDVPGQDDHDRALNERGRKAARAMGRFLAREGPLPTRVLCSTAVRARETWERAARSLGTGPTVEFEDALYLADAGTLLERIQGCGAEPCLLLIAHQPGMQDLARRLAGSGDPDAWERMRARYPTGALATLSFDAASWADVAFSAGELLRFVAPRELP